MNIITFCGEKKSGKDYLCEFLAEKYGAKRLSFSDEVRRLSNILFPWLPFHIDPEIKDLPFVHHCNPNNLTPREIWLTVGKVRDVYPNYFVEMFQRYQWPVANDKDELYIITDLRTPQEFKFLSEFKEYLPIIKIEIEDRTGIQEDPFEDWVRNFTDYDYLFVNKLDGTERFDKFFEETFYVNLS